jgi:SAM-dependent methyltransferase
MTPDRPANPVLQQITPPTTHAPQPGAATDTWSAGIADETAFWDEWLATRGGQWPDAFRDRINPERPLQPYLEELLDAQGLAQGSRARLLDVGAGPLTYVGFRSARYEVALEAVDPLAPEYDRLMALHGVLPVVRTQTGEAEQLDRLFPANHFHVITARNCLDHAYDPLRALRAMLAICVPGGALLLQHAVAEGERQGYHGLHQWNFVDEAGDLWLTGQGTRTNLTRALRPLATVRNEIQYNGEWIATWLTKHRRPWLERWTAPRPQPRTVTVDDPARWLPQ